MHFVRRDDSRAACTAGNSSDDEHADDRDHDQQFHQRERPTQYIHLGISFAPAENFHEPPRAPAIVAMN